MSEISNYFMLLIQSLKIESDFRKIKVVVFLLEHKDYCYSSAVNIHILNVPGLIIGIEADCHG